ncbi:MAG: hypothetical protein VB013_07385 [Anaerolineaceae bacterium]|nr:hypothetical protein [Anaerolineaceae bacterium]
MNIELLRQWNAQRDTYSILETLNVNTGQRMVLKEFDQVIEAPNWTRDGRFLVYNSSGRIYKFELSTGTIKEVPSGFAVDCNNDHVLSPDNSQIAVSHHTFEDAASRIYILPFSGGEPRLVTENAPSYLHGWSPDGSTLAYCAERNGQYDIYTISVMGGQETQLTNLPGLDDGPEYSPDGRFIWFNSVRSGLMQVWRMHADGADPTRMTYQEANCWFPHLSPDGKKVVFIAYRKGDVEPGDHPANKNVEIYLMSSESGEAASIAQFFGGQGSLNVNSWAPDNQIIAFVSYRLK